MDSSDNLTPTAAAATTPPASTTAATPADEQPALAHFERAGEFLAGLSEVLGGDGEANLLDDEAKDRKLAHLAVILDEYQEQSYLLDPHLEAIVSPPVAILQGAIKDGISSGGGGGGPSSRDALCDPQIHRIARLLYTYTKVRGYKTIARFFPHQVSDVVPTLVALQRLRDAAAATTSSSSSANSYSDAKATQWHLRYILLLWLSLVVMIPFDLDKFRVGGSGSGSGSDSGSGSGSGSGGNVTATATTTTTTDRVVDICQSFLDGPGKERDAAAVTLGKLFQRRDASQHHFPAFLHWACERLMLTAEEEGEKQTSPAPTTPPPPSAFLATGILHTLCEVLKTATPAVVVPHLARIQAILSLGDHDSGRDCDALARLRNNSLVNKYRSKLAARMGLKVLRPRRNGRGVVRRHLDQGHEQQDTAPSTCTPLADADDADVPESIDDYIAQLLNGLSDKDTVVRYSSAKGLARICERLPAMFIDQVAEAATSLFQVNVLRSKAATGSAEEDWDLSAVSEYTWQGACFALAELGRRGLLNQAELGDVLECVRRALFFDIRRGSHSIGSAVRDAACYVLWALARAYDPDAIRPHALPLARSLVTVSLLDRDVSIRRAASAAFQECVGRLGLFPHGIDIIPKTDFFSIGVRRTAFLRCLPAVARHTEYRQCLLDHLLGTTIVHWDPSMRELGAQAAAAIAELDLEEHAPHILYRLGPNCKSRDTFILHGTLLALAELGAVCGRSFSEAALATQVSIFRLLDDVPRHALKSLAGNGQILEAACRLIASCASARALAEEHTPRQPVWDSFVDAALAHKDETAHRAAAEALRAISHLRDCADRIQRAIDGWKTLPAAQQQGFALALGSMRFEGGESSDVASPPPAPAPAPPQMLPRALRFLVTLIQRGSPSFSTQIETRRNATSSLVSALRLLGPSLPARVDPPLARDIFTAILHGLDDYTSDRRGDVGSWVRAASLRGIRELLDLYRGLARAGTRGSTCAFAAQEWISADVFHEAVAAVAKQMVERIDSLRAEAAGIFLHLYAAAGADGDASADAFPRPLGAAIVRSHFADALSREDGTTAAAAQEHGPDLRSPAYLFPRAMHLLRIARYRPAVLRGILHALGTNTELSHRFVGPALVEFTLGLGAGEGAASAELEREREPGCQPAAETDREAETPLTPLTLLSDLVSLAETHFRDSKVALPALLALSVLIEGGVLDVLPLALPAPRREPATATETEMEMGMGLGMGMGMETPASTTAAYALLERALRLATRSLDKIKSPARLSATMKLGVDLLGVPPRPGARACPLRRAILRALLPTFLAHPYATLRAHTAEHLYVVLSTRGVVRLRGGGGAGAGEGEEWEWEEVELSEEAEELLLGTNWAAEECEDEEEEEEEEEEEDGEGGEDERAWLRRRARRLVAELE